jgi:hypothetical protein
MLASRCRGCPHVYYTWQRGVKEYPQVRCTFPNEYSWPTAPPEIERKILLTFTEAVHKTPKWCPLQVEYKLKSI